MKLTPHELDSLASQFRLSPRETQVVEMLFLGVPTNADTAKALATTEAAIKAAVRTLYLKTQTRSKHELVLLVAAVLKLQIVRDNDARQASEATTPDQPEQT